MATNLEQEFTRKRKNSSNPPADHDHDHDHDHDFLTLSLSIQPSSNRTRRPPPLNFSTPPPPTAPPQPLFSPEPFQPSFYKSHLPLSYDPYLPVSTTISPSPAVSIPGPSSSSSRSRRQKRSPNDGSGRNDTIPPPYPWATDKKAIIHTLTYLRSNGIRKISGEVRCKTCFQQYEMEFDLEEKFNKVGGYLAENKVSLCDRAPTNWTTPVLPTCKMCGQQHSIKPVISEEMEKVNWLFLLLGEMIGMCKLEQLKYLCKKTKNHCTGAKDRLVYLVYLTLCNQLLPDGPFQR